MDNILTAIKTIKVENSSLNRKTVTVVHNQEDMIGWNTVKISASYNKDKSKWNKVDLRNYVRKLYRDKYLQELPSPPAVSNMVFTTIEDLLANKTGQDTTSLVMIDYIDFYFDRYIDEVIRREGYFSIYKLKKPVVVLEYLKNKNLEKPVQVTTMKKVVDVVEKPAGVTLDDLNGAFLIHSRYFITNYGLILPVNYLLYVKKKTMTEALQYVKDAIKKIGSKEAVCQTALYGPYPDWFEFLNTKELGIDMNVEVDKSVTGYNFLRNH